MSNPNDAQQARYQSKLCEHDLGQWAVEDTDNHEIIAYCWGKPNADYVAECMNAADDHDAIRARTDALNRAASLEAELAGLAKERDAYRIAGELARITLADETEQDAWTHIREMAWTLYSDPAFNPDAFPFNQPPAPASQGEPCGVCQGSGGKVALFGGPRSFEQYPCRHCNGTGQASAADGDAGKGTTVTLKRGSDRWV